MTNINYVKRIKRIRKKLKKVNSERFRLTVFRSSRNILAQIIDDKNHKTLVSASSIICADILRDDLNMVNLYLSELTCLSFLLILCALFLF